MDLHRKAPSDKPHRVFPLLCAQAALQGFAVSLLYTAANSLFLVTAGSAKLPLVYLAIAATLPPLFALLLVLQKRISLSFFSMAVLLSFSALLGAAGTGAERHPWLVYALMVGVVLATQAGMILLGARAGRLWNIQEMKRRYPLVMAAQIAGVVAGGGLAGSLNRLTGGTENLLFFSSGALASAALVSLVFPDKSPSEPPRQAQKPGKPVRAGALVFKNPYIRRLLSFRVALELGSNMVNFLFLSAAALRFAGAEELTGFLGMFTATATLLTLLFLLFVSGRVLLRFGVGVGLSANPLAVGAILCGAAAASLVFGEAAGGFFILVLSARIVNFVVVSGLSDSSLKAAYQPLEPRLRISVQTLAEGVGVPLAVGAAGGLLLLIDLVPGITLGHIALFTLLIMAGILVLAFFAFRSYRETLDKALSGGRVPPERISLTEEASLSSVLRLLDSPRGKQVRYALEILEEAGSEAHLEKLPRLLDHPDPEVRREVLECMEIHRLTRSLDRLKELLETEKDPSVLSRAVRVLCALDPEAERLAPTYMNHRDPDIRRGFFAGLLRSRGIDGVLLIAPTLCRLLASPDPEDRLFAARLTGEVGSPDFISPLAALLKDSDVTLKKEALRAASRVPAAALVPEVVRCMEDRTLRSEAVCAAAAFGTTLLPWAAGILSAPDGASRETRLCLVRACGRISAPESTDLLASLLRHPDPETRHEAGRALSLQDYHAPPEDRPALRSLVLQETEKALFLRNLETGPPGESRSPLASAVKGETDLLLRHVFRLLSFLYRPPGIALVHGRLKSPDARERSLAQELLEVTLDRELRRRVTDLYRDPSPSPGGTENIDGDLLSEILSSPETWPYPWVTACALYAAARESRSDLLPLIRCLLSSGDRRIARTAQWAVKELSSNQEGDSDMTDIERVVLLKSSPIFEETPDQALASLAALADRLEAIEGETIIHKGDLESCLYVIARGKMRVHDGERTIAFLEAGEIIGEMALLDPAPRAASVTACENSVLFRLDKDAFDIALADNPEIAHGVLRVLCRRLRLQIQRAG
ncbi:MAG: HEAT repeat domain-containing protein [Spirochaetales bacterium]|nr:HEAT repeat domain-containing protein [Spirochaetales bacterium]